MVRGKWLTRERLQQMLKGSKGTVAEFGQRFTASLALDYVEIPILAKFMFGPAGRVRPFLFTGPVPAFNTRAEFEAEEGGEEEEADIDDEVKAGDFGWAFGGGVEISGFSIDARYNVGLVAVDEDSADIEGDVKNRAFSILFGYRWSR